MQELYSQSTTRLESKEISKVLRNTYMLLAMTIAFSAVTAGIAMAVNLPHIIGIVCSFAAIGLVWFVLPRTANTSSGIYVVFAFTGLLGISLGPLLNHYLALANGGAIVTQALGGTALVFFALSGYALTTQKDFSFMRGFLVVGMVVVLLAIVGSIVGSLLGYAMSALSLAISGAVILLMSGFILYDTSRIIHGGETNYIMATTSLYISIYNIFTSLLHLIGAFGGDD